VLADSTTRGAGRRPTSTPFHTLVFATVLALAITTLAAARNAWIAMSLKPAVALQS
jgi:ABC-type lipoprotein release transport system permease subunit